MMRGRLDNPKYLIGHWPLNSHSSELIAGNNGTWTNEAYADDQFGRSAASFNNANKYITVGNVAAYDFATTDFSWAFWFMMDVAIDANDSLIAKRDGGNAGYYISARTTTKLSILVEDADGTSVAIVGDSELNDGIWHHGVATVETGVISRLYVDGVAQAATGNLANVSDISNSSNLVFGADSSTGSKYFGGIGEIRVYNIVLTADEVLELCRNGVPKQISRSQPIPQVPDITDSTLALGALNWKTSAAADLSSNNKDGTATDVIFDSVGAKFNGTSSKIDFGDIANIQEVSMLIKPTTTTESILQIDGATDDIVLSAGTVTYGAGLTETATYVDGVASTTLVAGQWQHLVCQFSTKDANNFEIGWDGASYGDMEIREINAYTTARALSQITKDFAKSVPDSNLKLHSLIMGAQDLSIYATNGVPSGGVTLGNGGVFDGVDGKIDFGDRGNIQEVEFWVKPTAGGAQELILIDTGKDIMTDGTDIIYTGLTTVATYVNGVAAITLAAGFWQHVVCQFTQVDANNFEVGTDGSNFGDFSMRDLRVRDGLSTADQILRRYEKTRRYH